MDESKLAMRIALAEDRKQTYGQMRLRGARQSAKALIAVLALVMDSAAAKCIDVRQEVVGVVQDIAGQPIAGAIVRASWKERGEIVTRTEQTNQQGRFTLYVIFNAYSGSGPLGQDRCDGKFEEFLVVVSKRGFQDAAQRLNPSKESIRLTLPLQSND
jgi:hypothetical protein